MQGIHLRFRWVQNPFDSNKQLIAADRSGQFNV